MMLWFRKKEVWNWSHVFGSTCQLLGDPPLDILTTLLKSDLKLSVWNWKPWYNFPKRQTKKNQWLMKGFIFISDMNKDTLRNQKDFLKSEFSATALSQHRDATWSKAPFRPALCSEQMPLTMTKQQDVGSKEDTKRIELKEISHCVAITFLFLD